MKVCAALFFGLMLLITGAMAAFVGFSIVGGFRFMLSLITGG